jgi:hypothetical protein
MSDENETAQTAKETIRILILGDVHLDTLVLPLSRKENSSKEDWWRVRRRGGAWLLEEIIGAAFNEMDNKVKPKVDIKSYDHKKADVEDEIIQSHLGREYQSSAAILTLLAHPHQVWT